MTAFRKEDSRNRAKIQFSLRRMVYFETELPNFNPEFWLRFFYFWPMGGTTVHSINYYSKTWKNRFFDWQWFLAKPLRACLQKVWLHIHLSFLNIIVCVTVRWSSDYNFWSIKFLIICIFNLHIFVLLFSYVYLYPCKLLLLLLFIFYFTFNYLLLIYF